MSICYLINPLQVQVYTILHEISHGIELPSYVMTHETNSKGIIETHMDHSHDMEAIDHEHNLIDFVNTIFQESNESNDSNDSQLTDTKWDKHITSYGLKLPPYFEIRIADNFYMSKQFLQQGQFKRLGRPPQNLIG